MIIYSCILLTSNRSKTFYFQPPSGQKEMHKPDKCEKIGQFMCQSNNQCIPNSYKCDFEQDCPGEVEKSDESAKVCLNIV